MEALPDELRQEVLQQHIREQQRLTQQAAMPPPASINPEFLDALPADIREEIIQQERAEAARREREATGNQGNPTRVAADIDPASFLATLDPTLRQAVLLEQDEEFLLSLPPTLAAEATALRDRIMLRHNRPVLPVAGFRQGGTVVPANLASIAAASSGGASTSKRSHRDAIQLVDKGSVMCLIRLLFIPEPVSKSLIHRLLSNVCENCKTRTEVIALFLSVLVESCADLVSVDKLFSSISSRGKGKAVATPKKQKDQQSVTLAASTTGGIPNLVIQRCLEALVYLINSNDRIVNVFLNENEVICSMASKQSGGRSSIKKKGKEKALPRDKYPIVLLMGLLDRPVFLQNSNLMEQLSFILSMLVRPLSSQFKKLKVEEDVAVTTTSTTSTTSSAVNSESSATAATSTATISTTATASIVPETSTLPTGVEAATAATQLVSVSTPVDVIAATAYSGSSCTTPAEEKKQPSKATTNTPLIKLPNIPDQYIRSAVQVLTGTECSNKTFQHTLSIIQHFAVIKENEKIIIGELAGSVQRLGDALLPELQSLSKLISESVSKNNIPSSSLAKFSGSSSLQSKLLRVLKTIDFMHIKAFAKQSSLSSATTAAKEAAEASADKEKIALKVIYDGFNMIEVWNYLGKCLDTISSKEEIIGVATVLLPLIEAFMVVAKPYVLITNKMSPIIHSLSLSSSSIVSKPQSVNESMFVTFTEEHRKILNTMVRNSPSLMSGSFSLLVQNPKVLEFDNKRTYFNQQLHKRIDREHYGSLQINVRRQYVFEDSYHQLQGRLGDEIKYGKLSVRFHEEEGVDAGGVAREWFSVLARQMFNPDYALFRPSAVDKVTYLPNRSSWINPEHLSYFKFVGRIIGKAIYDGRLLDCYFTRSFYKCMLEIGVDWKDMEAVDPEFHKSLEWILNNDITDVLDLTFSCEVDDFGKTKNVDLKPGGSTIPVTQENKQEYVKLITEQKLTIAIKEQISSFLSGFHDVIPKDLIKIFNEQELELLISGMPDIDIDDWKNNTEYQNYTSSSIQVQWFWRVVRSFSQEERAKLIQFVTGTSKVPLEGFANLQGSNGIQKFQIHKDFGSVTRLPSAHTW